MLHEAAQKLSGGKCQGALPAVMGVVLVCSSSCMSIEYVGAASASDDSFEQGRARAKQILSNAFAKVGESWLRKISPRPVRDRETVPISGLGT